MFFGGFEIAQPGSLEVSWSRSIIKFLGYSWDGVVQVGQVPGLGIFLKSASRLLPDGWVGLEIFGCRCDFRAFQLELDILGTKNIEIGSVGTKLQLYEVG